MAKAPVRKSTPPEPEQTAQAPEVSGSGNITQTNVLVANQHSGPIILPRVAVQGEQRIQMAPTILHPGTVTLVDGEVWKEHKKLVVIQHYLDKRLLAEVNVSGDVPVMGNTSTDLQDCVPEHLQTAEEQGNISGVTAKVTKTDVGNIKV